MRTLRSFVSLFLLIFLFGFLFGGVRVADARPFRGSTKIYVILCQTSDSGAAPRTIDHYRNLLFASGTGGRAR